MSDLLIEKAKIKFHKTIDLLKQDLATIRTGRAAPSLIENLEISAYGAAMRLIELATITAPEPHILLVTPFDQTNINEIAKTILGANIGLNPVVDNNLIRITVPMLTEERRIELVKMMHQKLEGARVMVRQSRREMIDEIQSGAQNEDEVKRLEKELQDLVDKVIGEIDLLGEIKEKELLTL
jgi:ribosome recycling factor